MDQKYLHNPTFLELDDAYRGLGKLKGIRVKTEKGEAVLRDMEKIGFVAMEIDFHSSGYYNITAFKGKHGPCHYTGWKARYNGAALAVLDDDHHLISAEKWIAICDKTYSIYCLPPYKDLIKYKNNVLESDPSIDREHVQGNEDFETSLGKLYDKLKGEERRSDAIKVLFYPGPFRLLILKDGSMVRRGKLNNVPTFFVKDLVQKDGLIEQVTHEKVDPVYFQDIYANLGSTAILDDFKPQVIEQPDYPTDFSQLRFISEKLRKRILKLLDENRKYFVLIGNEAEDKLGCCPSEEVSEANRLVKYGILSSFSEPAQGDSCPVSLYSFKGELTVTENEITGEPDSEFRKKVRSMLKKSSDSGIKQVLKWILLGFVLISFVMAARQCYDRSTTSSDEQMIFSQLYPEKNDQVLVILFHNKKRCYQCLQMEEYTRDVLNEFYANEMASGQLAFKTLVIDDPENATLVEHYGIFAATLVFVNFEEKEIVNAKVLFDATGLYREEDEFKKYIQSELQQFFKKAHE